MPTYGFTPEQCRALFVAARRVIQWRNRDEGLIEALGDIPATQERHFDEDADIYEPLRNALAVCGWRPEEEEAGDAPTGLTEAEIGGVVPDYEGIARAAGYRLNHVAFQNTFYWYRPGQNVDDPADPSYREGDVLDDAAQAWRDCCLVNNLV